MWRIDFQLGWDADPVAEREPERVLPRVQALLGKDAQFELEWASVYTFSCLRMASFRDGRVFFAGDSAHGVSPFGARGANSGVQDAENLAWKLRLVLEGKAPDRLLDTYGSEREFAADENILNSTRSTDFITPKSEVSRTFRNATLELARDCPFARQLVNSGRLSRPATLSSSPLNTPDEDSFSGAMTPGAACTDAPVLRDGAQAWLIDQVGEDFTLLHFHPHSEIGPELADGFRSLAQGEIPVRTVVVAHRGQAPRETEDFVCRRGRRPRFRAVRRGSRARPISCAPTSMSRRAGAPSTPSRFRPRSTARRPERERKPHADPRTQPQAARMISTKR